MFNSRRILFISTKALVMLAKLIKELPNWAESSRFIINSISFFLTAID